ncbi:capsule biosynthesis protein CapK [Bacillus timonensis]|nr:capsule biosynthesis protein CapK [Bacillus timonensis]
MEGTLTIRELAKLFKKRFLLIFSTIILVMLFAFIATQYILKPTYEYSTQVVIGKLQQDPGSDVYSQSLINTQLIQSYIDLVKSPLVVNTVKKELKLKRSAHDLRDQISISNSDNSQIVMISVKDTSPQRAKEIAIRAAKVSQKKMSMFTSIKNIEVLYDQEIAEEPELVFPKPLLSMAIAFFVGLFAGIGLAVLRDTLDDRVKSVDELQSFIDIPIVGNFHLTEGILYKRKRSETYSV